MKIMKKKMQGFALNIAIFFLVVVSLLISAMVYTINRSNDITVLDILESKAEYTAKTGISHAIALIKETPSDCPTTNRTYALPDGFYYTVKCTYTTENEAAIDTTYVQILSIACNNATCPISGVPPRDYVEKQYKAVYVK